MAELLKLIYVCITFGDQQLSCKTTIKMFSASKEIHPNLSMYLSISR